MTPAVKLLKKKNIAFTVHEYSHDKNSESYGLEAAEKLGVEHHLVFKTLVVALDSGELVVAILPVTEKLSMKLVAKIFSAKKAKMANASDVLRSTGYVLGGVSPIAQKKRLQTVMNTSAFDTKTFFISAGRRGLEIELSPVQAQKLVQAKSANICL